MSFELSETRERFPGPNQFNNLSGQFPGNQTFTAMAYVRKTQDEFQIVGDYGQGWEVVTTEDTQKEARERLKEYRENEPGTRFQLKVKRVPIQPAQQEPGGYFTQRQPDGTSHEYLEA